jgi:DNA-binding transcriptional ArsR family regulator
MIAQQDPREPVTSIAAAIGERARARMLYALLDGRARTGTELAAVAEVTPSTASVHLNRLQAERLVKVLVQGKHHYFSLMGPQVAEALESLSVLAGRSSGAFQPTTPKQLRGARTCYDHMAGALAVALTDRILRNGWLVADTRGKAGGYEVSKHGSKAFAELGIDLDATRALRRRLAYACLDWSERRPHLGGSLAAALLKLTLQRRWVLQDPDGRALEVTRLGRRELQARFGVGLEPQSAK